MGASFQPRGGVLTRTRQAKPLKGKQLTLLAKAYAALVVTAALALKVSGVFPGINIDEVIKGALFVVAIFAPVDVSIWIEKFIPPR